MPANRRDFLRSSLAASTLVSMGAATVPAFVSRSARAAADGTPNDKVLVVVQLLGGNDGVNTVVPFEHDGYLRGRRALRLKAKDVHKLGQGIGLHPSMGGLAKLVDEGKASVVQGVGYPNPDRSHFRSMEIWESARLDPKALDTGWIGRALDGTPVRPGEDVKAIHVGTRALPLALRSRRTEAPSIASLEQYRLTLAGSDAERDKGRDSLGAIARLDRPGDDPLLGFLRRSTLSAYESSRRLEQVARSSGVGPKYPNYGLSRRLELIGQVIKAGFGTRIFYTSLDGFDTHANQLGTHAALLTELSDSLAAFQKDLAAAGHSDRVAVLAFSEFGRRVAENASSGTDHGAAAPVFVVGPVAKSGLVGDHPSLDKLDDGDLVHHTDFRRVYASLLKTWLGCAASPVIGQGFAPLELFRRSGA